MIYKIQSDRESDLTLIENDEARSVAQNVLMIFGTRRGTIPMYRDFGLPMEFIDQPAPVVENILAAELREALEEFEPRASLKSVSVDYDEHGKMNATLEVDI